MAECARSGPSAATRFARRVEDVPVALLHGDRQLLLGTGLQFAHPVLLVLGQIEQTLGLLQFPQGQAAVRLAPHLVLALLVGGQEYQIVAQRPQRGTLRAFALVNPRDELGHALDGAVGGHAVVSQHSQLRTAVADFVGNVERPAGEIRRFEGLAAEYLADAVVELGAGFAGIDVALLAADDLMQIGLRQKAHRRAGAGRRDRRTRR